MHRITRFIAGLLLLCVSVAHPQTQSSTASASITTTSSLTLTHVSDLVFPTSFAGSGLVQSGGTPTGAAQWSGTATNGSFLSVAFVLPTTLSDGASHTIPFSCGTTSADLAPVNGGGSNNIFDPNAGLSRSSVPTTGTFSLAVGNNGSGAANGCQVDLTSALGNRTYTNVITTTVSVVP